MKSTIELLSYAIGIYTAFLTWSYLQEKITKSNYSTDSDPDFFHAPLIINLTQSLFCILIGSIYQFVKSKSKKTSFIPNLTKNIIYTLYVISVTQTISTYLSYKSLDYIDYIFYLLSKSCKLIPVMIIHYLIFNTKYPVYKYIIAIIITLGVVIFTIHGKRSTTENETSIIGSIMLLMSLLLDGFMNSTQDVLLSKNKGILNGIHLMILINLFTFLNLLVYVLLFTDQSAYLFQFINKNGYEIVFDIFKFSLCGSLGQIFIFLILEKFNSVILVTITVTRKMLSMLLSVLLFGHKLKLNQWVGLGLVFIGIGLESFIKIYKKKEVQKNKKDK